MEQLNSNYQQFRVRLGFECQVWQVHTTLNTNQKWITIFSELKKLNSAVICLLFFIFEFWLRQNSKQITSRYYYRVSFT